MKQPWFKLFPGDWRQCPELRACSLAARGLWIDLMCRAHQTEPYGHVVYESVEEIALDVGRPLAEVQTAFEELERRKVFSRISGGISGTPGVIASRRMVRDEQTRVQNRKNAALGGNPALLEPGNGGRITERITASGPRPDIPQKSEARDQKERAPRGKPRLPISEEVKGTCLATPAFVEAMESWESSHGRYKPAGLRAQLHRLGDWGEARAVAAIKYSLAQGFQGIYEERAGTNGHAQKQTSGRAIPSKSDADYRRDRAETAAWNEWRVKHPERRPKAEEIEALIQENLKVSA